MSEKFSTAILLTARLKSERLPRKALKPIFGRPMIAHEIDRLKQSRAAEAIILCTSSLSADDPLAELAAKENIFCYRGHPEDVLLRLTEAAETFGVQTVISCTGDNPFTDPQAIDELASFHQQGGHDFSRIDGLPLGTYAYALSLAAMKRACALKTETDTEMWGSWFTDTGNFDCAMLGVADPILEWPDLRLTVDTQEDFELVNRIFGALYEPGKIFSLKAILALCRKQPDLPALNRHVVQRRPRGPAGQAA